MIFRKSNSFWQRRFWQRRCQITGKRSCHHGIRCGKRGLTLGIRTKTASDWLLTLTGSRKLFSPTSVYLMTLRAGQLQSPHGFLRVALPRLQLFTKGNLMLDKQSCNSILAEDDSTPRVYERTYHSCKYIHYTVDPLSLFDPLQPFCTPCSAFYLYLYHLANFITSDRLALNPQIYTLLRASTSFIMDVPWQFITISSLAGSFGLVRLAPQYSPSNYFIATFLLVFLGEIIAAVTWQAILWPRFISPLRHLPEPPVRSTFRSNGCIVLKRLCCRAHRF